MRMGDGRAVNERFVWFRTQAQSPLLLAIDPPSSVGRKMQKTRKEVENRPPAIPAASLKVPARSIEYSFPYFE